MSASNSPGATWYAATTVAAPSRPELTHDLDVDVCVLGGGLAGLTAAREIARLGWSVALVEADRVAAHASGRNGGVVAPGFCEPISAIVERVGLKRASELWALSTAGVEYVRTLIRETAMEGVAPVDGHLIVRTIDNEDDMLREVALMRVDLDADVEAWPTAQVREALLSPVYFQGMHLAQAFHIHAPNYALGLAAAAEQAGVRIFERTPALAIDSAGVRKRVDAPNGRIRAGQIVLAGGVGLRAVYPLVAETVLPVTSYVAVTAPLGEKLAAAMRYTGAVTETRRARSSYRVVGGDCLMWGGRMTVAASSPHRVAKLVQHDIGHVFPQLRSVEIAHAWAGVAGYAVHSMPQIGEVDRGVWLANAFGLHGINVSAMAGSLIARAIVEGDDRWRLFSDYELVWVGGRLGRAAAQVFFWSAPARDAAASGVTRLRQALHRRATERASQRMAAKIRRAAQGSARRATREAARLAAADAARRQAHLQAAAEADQGAEEAQRPAAPERARRQEARPSQRPAPAGRRRAAVPDRPDAVVQAPAINAFDETALQNPTTGHQDLPQSALELMLLPGRRRTKKPGRKRGG
jgi:glycine/D-amino acid oxidase-like deaminating enzyme